MRFSRSRSSGSVLARLALGLFAVFLAVSLFQAADRTVESVHLMYRLRGETPAQERARCYGSAYTDAIETIRRTIPRDGAYVLVNGDSSEHGGPLWVKFDLAPRRAFYLGDLASLANGAWRKKHMPRAARWVVIAYGPYRRPVLIERRRFVQGLKERDRA